MKNLLLLILFAVPLWAGDVFIESPLDKSAVTGIFTLKVGQPYGNPASIRARLTYDVPNGPDRVVWRGELKSNQNYTAEINTKGFTPGEYEIKVSYFFQGQEFDGDIDVYVNVPQNAPY